MEMMPTQVTSSPARVRQVWWLLKLTYGILPIVAGLDKFFNFLVPWEKYFNPKFLALLPVGVTHAVYAVGIIEIVAGLLVLSRFTRIGAYVVTLWLLLIAANLVSLGMYYDVAVRDVVLAVGAWALAMLSV